tara:strand:- start:984 stop:1187 length:204 start_codon:yes stop_codon:yes gene_type:complete
LKKDYFRRIMTKPKILKTMEYVYFNEYWNELDEKQNSLDNPSGSVDDNSTISNDNKRTSLQDYIFFE